MKPRSSSMPWPTSWAAANERYSTDLLSFTALQLSSTLSGSSFIVVPVRGLTLLLTWLAPNCCGMPGRPFMRTLASP
jgi:hypothetical protein